MSDITAYITTALIDAIGSLKNDLSFTFIFATGHYQLLSSTVSHVASHGHSGIYIRE